jgi:hypothetical protein
MFDPEDGDNMFLRTSVMALVNAHLLGLFFGAAHGGIL